MTNADDPTRDRVLKGLVSGAGGDPARPASDCPDEELLASYVEHGLAESEVAIVEAHFAECADCRSLAFAVRSAAPARVHGFPEPGPAGAVDPGPVPPSRRQRFLARFAAAAVILLAFGLLGLEIWRSRTETGTPVFSERLDQAFQEIGDGHPDVFRELTLDAGEGPWRKDPPIVRSGGDEVVVLLPRGRVLSESPRFVIEIPEGIGALEITLLDAVGNPFGTIAVSAPPSQSTRIEAFSGVLPRDRAYTAAIAVAGKPGVVVGRATFRIAGTEEAERMNAAARIIDAEAQVDLRWPLKAAILLARGYLAEAEAASMEWGRTGGDSDAALRFLEHVRRIIRSGGG